MELAGGEAFLRGAVAGVTENVKESWGEVDFSCEESACCFLAAIGEIGHCEVLLELVHETERFR